MLLFAVFKRKDPQLAITNRSLILRQVLLRAATLAAIYEYFSAAVPVADPPIPINVLVWNNDGKFMNLTIALRRKKKFIVSKQTLLQFARRDSLAFSLPDKCQSMRVCNLSIFGRDTVPL